MSEVDLIAEVKNEFRKWLKLEEVVSYVNESREKIPSRPPELYAVAFSPKEGYIKVDFGVVKMKRILTEDGEIRDVELNVVNEKITDPIMIQLSSFLPEVAMTSSIKFCRIFSSAKDRNDYFENILFLSDLSQDYQMSFFSLLRKKNGGIL